MDHIKTNFMVCFLRSFYMTDWRRFPTAEPDSLVGDFEKLKPKKRRQNANQLSFFVTQRQNRQCPQQTPWVLVSLLRL